MSVWGFVRLDDIIWDTYPVYGAVVFGIFLVTRCLICLVARMAIRNRSLFLIILENQTSFHLSFLSACSIDARMDYGV